VRDQDSTAPLSVSRPSVPPRGGVVVIQEAFGVNDHIEDVARRFADEGYLAVAPHLFHRVGDPKLGYDDLPAAMDLLKRLDGDEILDDVDAAIAELDRAAIPPERRFVVGFCMGGTIALVVATRRQVGAAVTFYGGGVKEGRFGFDPLVQEAPRLRAPWLGLFGDLDRGIPVEHVEELSAAAASSGQDTEVVRYPDAGHGFNCDQRPSYHAASAVDAWRRTLAWFADHSDGPG
jgi:carboxymethylenebutenolidase